MSPLRLLLLSTIVCIFASTTVFSQPANDDPANAIALTVSSGSCSAKTAGTTVDATLSSAPTPSCGEGIASDVWYKAVVPASGNLAIETLDVSSGSFDTTLTVYSGTPTSLTEVACDDEGGTDSLSKVVLKGQTVGVTLYIRVWGWEGGRAPFEICAWDPVLPTNDDPANATTLTVNSGSCGTKAAGSTVDASLFNAPTPSCGDDIASDVWYKAVVPASGDLTIETFDMSGAFDSVLTVYSGTPTSLTEVACDDNGGTDFLSKVVLTGQTVGSTLYIRVWGSSGDRNPFEICAWDTVMLPANDDPANATTLTVGSASCDAKTTGSTVDASLFNAPTPSCGDDIASDVWYKAVVPASGNLTIETFDVSGGFFDSVLTAYSGTPTSLTEIACSDNGGTDSLSKVVLKGQTVGATLYIRVWGVTGYRSSFEICAWDPVLPVNDDPANATTLTVGSGSCGTKAAGSTVDASLFNAPAPSCGDDIASDVWYKAAVPTSGNLTIETFDVSGGFFDSVLTVYSGTPTSLTEIACSDSGGTDGLSKVVLKGQTVGATLYIRVWGLTGYRSSFEICAWDPVLPANDDPANATTLTVGSGSCGTKTAGTTEEATLSNAPTPSCGGDIVSDVWYKAVVPASGNLSIETFAVSGGFLNSVLTVYSGTPTSLTEVACNDDSGDTALSKVVLTGQTAGTTLYIRAWSAFEGRDPFEICAWDPMPLSISNSEIKNLNVYPNPTTNTLHIDSSTTVQQAVVYSLTGAQLLSAPLSESKSEVDVSGLSTGVYVLRIVHEKGNQYLKFVKE